jgi:putative wall associated protein
LSLLAMATLVACSKNDDNGGDSANYLVKKITTKDEDGKLEEVITLTYEGGRPVSFSEANYENGVQTGTTQITTLHFDGRFVKQAKRENAGRDNYVQNFTYEGGKLVAKTEKYESDYRTYTYQYSYAGNQLKSVLRSYPTTIYVNGGTQSGTYYRKKQFTYSGNTVIVVTTQYEKDLNGAVVTNTSHSYGTYTTTYTLSDGNVVKVIDEDSYSISTREYTYDTKPNPLYYMTDFVEPDPTNFLVVGNGKHNILTYKDTDERKTAGTKKKTLRTYEYTYNTAGFPTVVKQYKEKGNGAREFQGTKEYEY